MYCDSTDKKADATTMIAVGIGFARMASDLGSGARFECVVAVHLAA